MLYDCGFQKLRLYSKSVTEKQQLEQLSSDSDLESDSDDESPQRKERVSSFSYLMGNTRESVLRKSRKADTINVPLFNGY